MQVGTQTLQFQREQHEQLLKKKQADRLALKRELLKEQQAAIEKNGLWLESLYIFNKRERERLLKETPALVHETRKEKAA